MEFSKLSRNAYDALFTTGGSFLRLLSKNGIDGEYQELDEDYMTAAQRLDEHYWILNSILDECGMNELDPRNAYDWLVLYSLYTKPDEDMDYN